MPAKRNPTKTRQRPNFGATPKSNASSSSSSRSSATPVPTPRRKKADTSSSSRSKTAQGAIRLNKFLSMAGEASRRKADEMIALGEVTVNGKVVTELGTKINPETDRVEHLGKPLRKVDGLIYILLNKPKDIITTTADERQRTTVIDLLGIRERVYPVGRLDRNTTGVLLLTNDGDLAAKLMHPSSEIKKTYFAELDKKLSKEALLSLRRGMRLSDTGEKVSPAEVAVYGDGDRIEITIHEGKNRQIHRMLYTLGYDVKKLERVSYAGLTTSGMRRGEWRILTPQELKRLKGLG